MQDNGQIAQIMFANVLFDARQQLTQHRSAHQLGLVVDGGVAKPVAIRTIDVAARGNLDQQLRNRLTWEVDRICRVRRHADTEPSGKTPRKLVTAGKSTAESAIRHRRTPPESAAMIGRAANKTAPEIGLRHQRLV